jgi:hypothetical protein
MIALALRTWLRFLVPLTVLAIVACAPLLYLTWTAKAPANAADARWQVRYIWALGGCALAFQLLLVAGVAPAVRAVAARAPLSQLGALVSGMRGLLRGFLPWLVAIVAVLLGGLALVLPGALLAILVSLTGASERLHTSPQASIADSIASVRTQLPRVALIVGAIVLVDLAIVSVAQLTYVPLISKKISAAKLEPMVKYVRASGTAIVALAPLAACFLAAAYSHTKRRQGG